MSSRLPPAKSRLAPYKQALAAVSQRTRTPLPSLIVSFAVLHELTAVVPVAGFFFGARALGLGERIITTSLPRPADASSTGVIAQVRDSWAGMKFQEWVVEGEARAERVGRRYGWFGFTKGSEPERLVSPPDIGGLPGAPERIEPAMDTGKLAGDVANFVVAYALTKALLPVRIGLSMYLAPPFSRTFVQPIGTIISRIFRRNVP